jgi:glutamate-ammonia-ligase adenylyltransferase
MDSISLSVSTRDLIRAGLQDFDTATALFGDLAAEGWEPAQLRGVLDALERACDPDIALRHLVDIVLTQHIGAMRDQELARLIRVLGASEAMGTLMRFRPALMRAAAADPQESYLFNRDQRRARILRAVGVGSDDSNVSDDSADHATRAAGASAAAATTVAPAASSAPTATKPLAEATEALRLSYFYQLAAIMAQDVIAADPLEIQPRISQELSDLADAALEGALAIARHEVEGSENCRFAIIGMGKLGARELNYVSDVDLIYVVEPADEDTDASQLTRIGTRIATTLQRVCQSVVPGVGVPALWQIDGGLRPEGKDGPLVRRLASHRGYYEQWASNWEFQALLKARPAAGDGRVGRDYMAMTRPFVWSASKRDNFVHDCQQMRKRVEDLIPSALKEREIKLGRGGLRDVEFTVQMLQLVHGRSDESLRITATLDALQALSQGGYVSRRQAARLSDDYRFERVLEHRQQMWALKRTHLFPDIGVADGETPLGRGSRIEPLDQNAELRRLARALRLLPEELVERYESTRQEVRRMHMDIYYRPMLPVNAQLEDDQIVLSRQAARDRFASIGFGDADAAIRHVSALTEGISRAAKINRFLLPAVLQWLGEGQNPDMGLLNWRRLEENFGTGSPYLGFLRDSPMAARRLCHILANSRFLGDALNKSVESITWLGNDDMLRARDRASLDVQCHATLERYADSTADFAHSMRAMHRHEIERVGLSWMAGVMDSDACLAGMTDVYDAILDAALQWSIRSQCRVKRYCDPPAALAVIGMGRYGGREINFSSDADAILIYRPCDGFSEEDAGIFAQAVVETLRNVVLGPVTVEPKIDLDLDLRPEGKNGPLVRSYASCEEYYAQWAATWEHQALLRARYAAGDSQLAEDFLHNIADPLRYPSGKVSDAAVGEIRKLKARMEAERLPRGVPRHRHLKLGKGGLSDVEWTVQLMQLRHAGQHEGLRVNSTLAALDELERLGYIESKDAHVLCRSWCMCTDARNGNYLWTGRAARADILPEDLDSLGAIAVYLGYESHHGQHFENDLLGTLRQCREVVERLFYGEE